jgi:hypothetical protein
MSKDHPVLVDIWGKLRKKRNVIALLDTEDPDTDIPMVLSWFEPITKDTLGGGDVLMKNGTFLCVRKILNIMPAMDPRVVGDYEVVVVPKEIVSQLKQGLQNV